MGKWPPFVHHLPISFTHFIYAFHLPPNPFSISQLIYPFSNLPIYPFLLVSISTISSSPDARGLRVALVVARYNDFVTDRLREGAVQALVEAGAAEQDIVVLVVPGAFEIPLAALAAANTGRYHAIVCLGCLIRGATPHFEYISTAVAHGITEAAAASGIPMTFGVLTTNSAEEALERAGVASANKGWEAARAAVEMARLLRELARADAAGFRV
jgi:6,7-dimethyl-8-ribityllumazine synthase